jgi:hypothetical protein
MSTVELLFKVRERFPERRAEMTARLMDIGRALAELQIRPFRRRVAPFVCLRSFRSRFYYATIKLVRGLIWPFCPKSHALILAVRCE